MNGMSKMSKTVQINKIQPELRCKKCGGIIIRTGPAKQRLMKCAMCDITFVHERVLEYAEVIS